MPFVGRLIFFACLGAGLVGFWLFLRVLDFGGSLPDVWSGLQISATLGAMVLCALAARASRGSDRKAWSNFAIGCGLYLAGNLFYLYCAVAGITPSFPAAPEALYFVMAVFFAAGMHQYGNVSERVTRVQLYNFILTYCGITASCLFLLNGSLAASVLPPLGTIVAFAYPALWFSVAAFGLVSILLYDHGRRRLPFALLLGAVLAEAAADLMYARELLSGVYTLGGPTQLLWVASAGMICCAAIEQIARARGAGLSTVSPKRQSERGLTQASVPAAAVAVLMLSGSISGSFGESVFSIAFSAGLAVVVAVVAGLREYWIISAQRQLSGAVENSRADLAETRRRLSSVLHSTSDGVVVVDRQWRIESFNQRAVETVGNGGLRQGANFWDVFPLGEGSQQGKRYVEAMETQAPAEFAERFDEGGAWLDVQAYPTDDGLSIFLRDLGRRALRDDLARALAQDEFELAYQPIVELPSNRVRGFEALLRWRHPDKGIISPEIFIPLAEETGLIVDIGGWVLRTACAEAATWPQGISVAVNLSTRQFADPGLPGTVERTLAASGLESGRLELEVTESALLADSRANLQTLARFRELGVRVALDDFGTGYSSLVYLQKFQFSKLKIDRSFIAGLPDNEESQAIVRAVIGLGKSLGMRVTAEGVETQAQLDWIAAGCDEAQGFLLGRPGPAGEIPAVLLKFASRPDAAPVKPSLRRRAG